MVFRRMFPIGFATHKVFWAIIVSDSIDMVHSFSRSEPTTEYFFHDESMLKDIPKFYRVWMFWCVLIYVTICSMEDAASPFWVISASFYVAFVFAVPNMTSAWRFVKFNPTGFTDKLWHHNLDIGVTNV